MVGCQIHINVFKLQELFKSLLINITFSQFRSLLNERQHTLDGFSPISLNLLPNYIRYRIQHIYFRNSHSKSIGEVLQKSACRQL